MYKVEARIKLYIFIGQVVRFLFTLLLLDTNHFTYPIKHTSYLKTVEMRRMYKSIIAISLHREVVRFLLICENVQIYYCNLSPLRGCWTRSCIDTTPIFSSPALLSVCCCSCREDPGKGWRNGDGYNPPCSRRRCPHPPPMPYPL